MKYKTSELIGEYLDLAVAKALGLDTEFAVEYSTSYMHSGFIIDHYLHSFDHMQSDHVCAIIKRDDMKNNGFAFGYGPTILIAAMRCFVSYKLGAVVEFDGF